MFGKNGSKNPDSIDTIIGINSVFEGNIECDGTIRVDGKIKGDIKVSGDVFVGVSAVITGNIFANNVNLSGTIEGNINSSGILRILSTAKLFGDIQVHSFVADEGGLFQGKCSMIEIPEIEKTTEKSSSKKSHSSRDYKKSSVLSPIYEDKDKNNEMKDE
jgi:cytoskeletal protein CcmA (bactofilin family)